MSGYLSTVLNNARHPFQRFHDELVRRQIEQNDEQRADKHNQHSMHQQ